MNPASIVLLSYSTTLFSVSPDKSVGLLFEAAPDSVTSQGDLPAFSQTTLPFIDTTPSDTLRAQLSRMTKFPLTDRLYARG